MTQDLKIRPYAESDSTALAEIYGPYVLTTAITFEYEPPTAAEMHRRMAALMVKGLPCIVAEDGEGTVVGYAYVHPWKERAAYSPTVENSVYLRMGCEGRGIGKALMDNIISSCRQLGLKNIIACITGSNSASFAFHKRLGFSQVSLFSKVGYKFGEYHDVIDLQLHL